MPNNLFDRQQNKINPEPVAPERKVPESEIANIKEIAEQPGQKQVELNPEKQEQVVAKEAKESEESPEKAAILKQINDYYPGNSFSEDQKNLLVRAISSVIQGGNIKSYKEVEEELKNENDALLDAFHDLTISNPKIRGIIENE